MKYKRHWVERKKQRAAPAGPQYTERFLCEKEDTVFENFRHESQLRFEATKGWKNEKTI